MQKPCFGVYMHVKLKFDDRYAMFPGEGGRGGCGTFIVVCYFKTEVNDAGRNQK